MRWYCWLIFFAVAIFSTWALPADGDVEERNSLLIGNEDTDIEDFLAESEVWDDDDGMIGNGTSGIIDRSFRRRKPQKNKQDDDYSSSKDTDKDTKKSKTTKCVCFGKKPFYYSLKPYPYQSGKPRPPPSSASTPASSSSSQRPGGQGYPNQSGSNTNRPNTYNEQRPRPPNGF